MPYTCPVSTVKKNSNLFLQEAKPSDTVKTTNGWYSRHCHWQRRKSTSSIHINCLQLPSFRLYQRLGFCQDDGGKRFDGQETFFGEHPAAPGRKMQSLVTLGMRSPVVTFKSSIGWEKIRGYHKETQINGSPGKVLLSILGMGERSVYSVSFQLLDLRTLGRFTTFLIVQFCRWKAWPLPCAPSLTRHVRSVVPRRSTTVWRRNPILSSCFFVFYYDSEKGK
jgi:hypothetical protein